jgi:uncharacterized protein DUF6283
VSWKLKRTIQCAKCPWRKDVNPHDIPDGYSVEKHRKLKGSIADPGSIEGLGKPMVAMACHETGNSHCIGWLMHQLGPGNNLPLRLRAIDCENMNEARTIGEQHECFEDTIPKV